jgi:sulfate/thiosulfate-binding protein
MKFLKTIFFSITLLSLLLSTACLPGAPDSSKSGRTITVYGFSIMKEALEKEIYPAFAAKWKREKGEDINFVSSFAGSETVTNQILQGAPADVAILSIERDVERLMTGGAVTKDWKTAPYKSIVNKTPFIILVRRDNPKNIKDFPDLAAPGVQIIHPDPVSSGGAMWSILAIYGSELKKNGNDANKALQTLQGIWSNVKSTPDSARAARTQFETGYGDVLITYELEGLLMKQAGAPVDIVVPKSTIFSEHPAVAIDRNVTAEKLPAVQAFLEYLWTDEAQKSFVKYHFRSITNETFNAENKEFATIEMPFTVELFGGWSRAYPEIIEGVFRDKVQKEVRNQQSEGKK